MSKSVCRICLGNHDNIEPIHQACTECITLCLDNAQNVKPWSYYSMVLQVSKKRVFNSLHRTEHLSALERQQVSQLISELEALSRTIFTNAFSGEEQYKVQFLREITQFKESIAQLTASDLEPDLPSFSNHSSR
ncbi:MULTISPECIES: hypothetical protein [Vibrio]|uniref:hypothetical protein n=1 Tax=Vibrio TaxID=662 RepID=UPI000586FEB5|nr:MULTISPECIES: hypothetical protein [Vibrio]MDE3898339.1 hypothetical protein [Vibrio sp. CC007]